MEKLSSLINKEWLRNTMESLKKIQDHDTSTPAKLAALEAELGLRRLELEYIRERLSA